MFKALVTDERQQGKKKCFLNAQQVNFMLNVKDIENEKSTFIIANFLF